MAYSIIEQQTRDLDIFFRDNEKYIHIATAGGAIPELLSENDIRNEEFAIEIKQIINDFQVDINPNLSQILELTDEQLEIYLEDFIEMAKRGFYSYDKSKLGNFGDPYFHLVAWPKDKVKVSFNIENLLLVKRKIPTDINSFNLFEYFISS